MIAQVEYTVPVIAFVNLDTGEVDRVVVADEEINLPRPASVTNEDYSDRVTPEQKQRALEIAEGANWPSWQFGF